MFSHLRRHHAERGSEGEVRFEFFISICFLCRPTSPAVFGLMVVGGSSRLHRHPRVGKTQSFKEDEKVLHPGGEPRKSEPEGTATS